MLNNNFRVLVLSQDHIMSQQLQGQLKSSFPSLEIKYHFLDNSSNAISLSKNLLPHLILAPAVWLNSKAEDFEQEIMRSSGLTHIIFFGKDLQVSSKTMSWPITQWGQLIEAIHDFIPQEIKDAAGLHKKDSVLYQLLASYGERYKSENDSFPENDLNLVPSQISPLSISSSSKTLVTEQKLVTHLPVKNWLAFEMTMLVALIALSSWSYRIEEMTVFYFSAITSALALISMYFSHYLLPRIKKAE